jgi:hypothetical protein
VRDAVDRHLALLEALEQRRLRLRRGAVDLVADDDVGEDGTGLELETAALPVVDRDARDVARQPVASTALASARASWVLPTPGTSSIKRWPSASRTVSAVEMAPSLPSITVATASRMPLARCWTSASDIAGPEPVAWTAAGSTVGSLVVVIAASSSGGVGVRWC